MSVLKKYLSTNLIWCCNICAQLRGHIQAGCTPQWHPHLHLWIPPWMKMVSATALFCNQMLCQLHLFLCAQLPQDTKSRRTFYLHSIHTLPFESKPLNPKPTSPSASNEDNLRAIISTRYKMFSIWWDCHPSHRPLVSWKLAHCPPAKKPAKLFQWHLRPTYSIVSDYS